MYLKNCLSFIVILLATSIAYSNCFEEKMILIGNAITYPQIAIDNEIEDRLYFAIKDKEVVTDSLKKLSIATMLLNETNKINWQNLLEECDFEKLPKSISIEFKLGEVDSIYVEGECLVVQKQKLSYILNPPYEECVFYTDSKMKTLKGIKAWSWNRIVKLKKGNRTVFKYEFNHEESSYWNGDERIEFVYFEIDNRVTEFALKDVELNEISLLYQSMGAKSYRRENILSGSVSGKKVNKKWIIQLSIEDLEFEREFRELFN